MQEDKKEQSNKFEELEFEPEYLDKLDLRSIIWRQLDRANYIGSVAGDSKSYINAIETLCSALRAYGDERFIGQIKEINLLFREKFKSSSKQDILKIQIVYADKKRDACMDFINRSGLVGSRGITETNE